MKQSDRNGNPIEVYPDTHLSGVFLGVNGEGLAEYLSADYVFLAVYTDGELQVPPEEYGIAHEFYLEDMRVADYIAETTEEAGPWRYLTDVAEESLWDAGYDPSNHKIDDLK